MNNAAKYFEDIERELGDSWLPRIYRERVLSLRTRGYEFPAPAKNAKAEIHHTLLGIELKVGRRRLLCPDLATARYLAVFARIGCRAVAIPYDITKISLAADELESSWHRMLLTWDRLTLDRSAAFRARIQRQLIGKVRDEIEAAGAGPRIPEFRLVTKQNAAPQEGPRSSKGNAKR
jgi:hypothetical protein